ncbi:MAG: RcnB family protein [Comamonas sp.]
MHPLLWLLHKSIIHSNTANSNTQLSTKPNQTKPNQTKPKIRSKRLNIISKKTEHPSHDWQQGHKVPAQYHGNSFKVDASKYKKLSKPTKNQQWIKVNGDYVLMNTATYKVIKVIQA